MKQFLILFVAAFVSCSKPVADQSSKEGPAASPIPKTSRTVFVSTPVPKNESPPEIRPTKGTGVKEKMVLAALNSNVGLEPQYHHEFIYVMTTDPPASLRVFGDKRSELRLSLSGPSNDLELITLLMPMDAFFGGDNLDTATGEGAAAFGRCVQRMGFAIDPSWGEDLYNWMNKNMMVGLLESDGIVTTHRHLLAKFVTVRSGEKTVGVSMMIGTPTKE